MTSASFIHLGTILLAFDFLLTVVMFFLLLFIVTRPDRWSRIVDKENDFWVRKRIVPASLADSCRRFEKGLGLKILICCGILLGAGSIAFIAKLLWHAAHR